MTDSNLYTSFVHARLTADALVQLGFFRDTAGVLHAPAHSQVLFAPTGDFFEIHVVLRNGTTVLRAIVSARAIKVGEVST
jgi:hypothetical protein